MVQVGEENRGRGVRRKERLRSKDPEKECDNRRWLEGRDYRWVLGYVGTLKFPL